MGAWGAGPASDKRSGVASATGGTGASGASALGVLSFTRGILVIYRYIRVNVEMTSSVGSQRGGRIR